jgi:putative ATP-dependent endonuclease of OLD family
MRIAKLVVENFRSIKKVELELDQFSIFVGQNNHGKTNLFEAIEWFYNAKKSERDLHNEMDESTITVEIHYEDVLETDITKLAALNQTKIRTMLDGSTSFMVRKTSTDHKRSYFVGDEDKGNPTGLDTAINEFLPKLEYVSTRIRLEDVSQYKDRNPIGQMLSGVLTAIIAESDDYKMFSEQFHKLFEDEDSEVRVQLNQLAENVGVYLKKQFPGDVEVRFTVNPPQFGDLLKSFDTTVNDGVVTKAQDKGDGMQRAIMLSIIQAFADFRKKQSVGSSFLFLIDEAELHLHPSAQRLLKQALIDISKTDQVMLNTQSSVLVVDEHENQKLFKVEKVDRKTQITEVGPIDKLDIIFELLGGSPHDLLLPRNFLIVEGKSEYELLMGVIRRHYPEQFEGIKILFAGGDLRRQRESIEAVDKTLRPLVGTEGGIYRDRLVVLLDKPNTSQQANYESFQTGYSFLFDTGRVFELPNCSLEECYPSPWTKTEDEVQTMGGEEGAKIKLAREVSSIITKDGFESGLTILFDALNKCDSEAFQQ